MFEILRDDASIEELLPALGKGGSKKKKRKKRKRRKEKSYTKPPTYTNYEDLKPILDIPKIKEEPRIAIDNGLKIKINKNLSFHLDAGIDTNVTFDGLTPKLSIKNPSFEVGFSLNF